jgi:hypothetical protein
VFVAPADAPDLGPIAPSHLLDAHWSSSLSRGR